MHADKIENAGLYLHIPFCINKCPYCDFYSITDLLLKQAFVEALLCEMRMLCNVSFLFDTMYIGGGTPSVLTTEDLAKIIEAAYRFFKISADVEITMELNPGTVDREHFAGFKSAGVNRINIGVQSFQDVNLDFLGRIHSGKEAELAIRWARQSGFNNIGLDLIYGIPGQTIKSWLLDLKRAVEFEPEHISCYMLTYESGTPMDKDRQKGIFCPAPDSHVCDMFKTTIDFLNSSGYAQYEISNFARSRSGGFKNFKSRHNQKYWSFAPYIGLGPSAHSFIEPERYWNFRNVDKYIKELTAGRLSIEGKEVLSREQQMIEAISLGLRMTDGIKTDVFDKKFNVSFKKIFAETIARLEENGLIRLTENRCSLTRKGMLFADSITSMLI